MRKKASDPFLGFLAAVAIVVAALKAIPMEVWWTLGGILLAWVVWMAIKKPSRDLPEYPGDEFGPLFTTPTAARDYYTRLMRQDPALAARLRTQQVLRESIQIALTSKKPETVNSRWETAEEMMRELRERHRVPAGELAPIEERFQAARLELATVRYINEAKGYLDKAAKVKTPKAQAKHRAAALATLEQGLADSQADPVLLKTFITLQGLQ